MQFVLIITVCFTVSIFNGGAGNIQVTSIEFNSREACENAAEYWQKQQLKHMKEDPYLRGRQSYFQYSYVCAPKGVKN